jgi:hypothetical protein
MDPFTQKRQNQWQSMLNSCSRIPLLQLMHCLKSVWPLFRLFCRSMSTCHRQTLSVSRNFVTSRCTVVFVGTSLTGYALLNASRTATNGFDAKLCSRINTRFVVNTPCSHLHSFCATGEQRPSNQDDLVSSITGEIGRVYYTWVDLLLSSFLYRALKKCFPEVSPAILVYNKGKIRFINGQY